MLKHNVCIRHYKDWKCAVNENPSVRIESAGSKTSNNGPLRNGSVVSNFSFGNSSTYEGDHAFKTIWRLPCLCHLVKIKGHLISTSCSGICYRIYARQKFLYNAHAPDGALALFAIFAKRISCNKRPHNQYLLLQYSYNTVII